MKNLHVKKDDMVVVIAGADRGKIGKVLATFPSKNRVLVEARRKKHATTPATAEA